MSFTLWFLPPVWTVTAILAQHWLHLCLWCCADRRAAVVPGCSSRGGGHRVRLWAAPSGGLASQCRALGFLLHRLRAIFSNLLCHFLFVFRLRWLPSSWWTWWECSNSSETSLLCGRPARLNWSVVGVEQVIEQQASRLSKQKGAVLIEISWQHVTRDWQKKAARS